MLQWLVTPLTILFMLEPVKPHIQQNNVSEIFENINESLAKLVTKSNDQLRDLRSVKEDLNSLRESVRSLNHSVAYLKESEIGLKDWRASLSNTVTGLNNSVRSLQEQLKEQEATTNNNTQQINMKLNTLISDLSQQTAAESAQLHFSFAQLHQSLTSNLTHQLEVITDRLYHPYTCGGTGGWRRVVYMDMTDPSTTCPSGWNMTGYSKRTCGKFNTARLSCDSVTFPVSGGEYSRVCGRIRAYQSSWTDAFEAYHDRHVTTIDGAYVSGVSVTHGSPRKHIWTFAAGASEASPTWDDACPCDASISIRVPPFVGKDYFCESGENAADPNGFYPYDPLWDGRNCTSSSTCCSFNTPPYFVKQLPTSTTDDIEARLCRWGGGDDSPIELIELYVQ